MAGVDVDKLYQSGEGYLTRDGVGTAESLARQLLAVAPRDVRGHVLLARARAARHGAVEGAKVLAALPAHLAAHPLAIGWHARLLCETGRVDDADNLLARLPASEDEPLAVVRWVRGRIAHARKAHADAVAELVVLTRNHPDDADSWRVLATNLVAAGRAPAAVQALEYVLAQDRNHAPTWRALVDAYLQSNNIARAAVLAQDALKLFPKDAELLAQANRLRALNTATGAELQARILSLQLLLDAGRVAEVQTELAALQKLYPTSRSLGLLVSEVAAVSSPDAEAVNLVPGLLKQVSAQPELWEPKIILQGLLLRPIQLRNPRLALELAEQAWSQAPGHPHVGFHLVRACAVTGRKTHARVLAAQLGNRAPELVDALLKVTA